MFERLADFIIQFIDLFLVGKTVDAWEKGVVLRFGRYHRMAPPGFCWLFPLGIERLVVEDTYKKVASLPSQSLTTADGVAVVVSPIITHRVKNVRKVILQAGGHDEAILSVVPGTVGELVSGAKWADLVTEEFRAAVSSTAAERVAGWGVELLDLQFADLVRAKSYRLLQEQTHK